MKHIQSINRNTEWRSQQVQLWQVRAAPGRQEGDKPATIKLPAERNNSISACVHTQLKKKKKYPQICFLGHPIYRRTKKTLGGRCSGTGSVQSDLKSCWFPSAVRSRSCFLSLVQRVGSSVTKTPTVLSAQQVRNTQRPPRASFPRSVISSPVFHVCLHHMVWQRTPGRDRTGYFFSEDDFRCLLDSQVCTREGDR